MVTKQKTLAFALALLVCLPTGILLWMLAETGGRTSPGTDVNSTGDPVREPLAEGTVTPYTESKTTPKEEPDTETSSETSELETPLDLDLNRDPRAYESLDYVAINDTQDFREFLSGFDVVHSDDQLSQLQKESLVDSLANWCLAFHTGSFADFQKFRVPAEYTIRQDAMEWQRYFLLNNAAMKAEDIPRDPQEMWALYWEKRNLSESQFKGLWQAVTVPQVCIRRTQSLPVTLAQGQMLMDRSAVFFRQGSVDFKRAPADVIREEGTLTYADVEVVVRHITGLTYPLVVRSFWDGTKAKWLPCEMIVCYTGRGRKADPDF